jgi:hypothetical protein
MKGKIALNQSFSSSLTGLLPAGSTTPRRALPGPAERHPEMKNRQPSFQLPLTLGTRRITSLALIDQEC